VPIQSNNTIINYILTMINLTFYFENPWGSRDRSVKVKDFPLTKNKNLEVALHKNHMLIGFSFGASPAKTDFGFTFTIALLGYDLQIMFYDNRDFDEEFVETKEEVSH